MKNVTRIHAVCWYFSAMGILLSTANVQASTCGELSPRLEALGDDYFSFDIEPAGANTNPANAHLEQYDANRLRSGTLFALVDNLRSEKFRGGEGERTVCHGSGVDDDTDIHEVTWQFHLEDIERVEMLNGEISITAWEDRHSVTAPERSRRTTGSVHAEVMDVPHPDEWVVNEDMTALVANRRHRRAGASSSNCSSVFVGNCTYLTEIDFIARPLGRTIELQQVFYINGQRSEWVTWRLDS